MQFEKCDIAVMKRNTPAAAVMDRRLRKDILLAATRVDKTVLIKKSCLISNTLHVLTLSTWAVFNQFTTSRQWNLFMNIISKNKKCLSPRLWF